MSGASEALGSKTSENIYPSIKITDPFLTRGKYMQEKLDNIKLHLKHCEKLKRRWSQTDSAFKITTVLLTFGTTLATAVTGGLLAPILVTTILGSLAAAETATSSILIFGLTSKKKGVYREKVNLINNYLNKLFYFSEKIKEDRDITIEELQSFDKLVKQFNTDLQYFKFKNNSNFEMTEGKYSTLSKNDVKRAQKIVKEKKKKEEMNNLVEQLNRE